MFSQSISDLTTTCQKLITKQKHELSCVMARQYAC